MKKSVLENFSIKTKCLVLTILVSFSFFVSENVFGYKTFNEKNISVKLVKENSGYIKITMLLYDYAEKNFGFLEHCIIKGVDEGNNEYRIMEIKVPEQKKLLSTELILSNKIPKGNIVLMGFDKKYNEKLWPENKSTKMYATVPTVDHLAAAMFGWDHNIGHKKLKYIEVRCTWKNRSSEKDYFNKVFNINKPTSQKIQSDNQNKNTDIKEINPIEVYGEAGAVVVKGAERGATIKICNKNGVEIKTVVANQSELRINLRANELYLIYIGKNQYKVVL